MNNAIRLSLSRQSCEKEKCCLEKLLLRLFVPNVAISDMTRSRRLVCKIPVMHRRLRGVFTMSAVEWPGMAYGGMAISPACQSVTCFRQRSQTASMCSGNRE